MALWVLILSSGLSDRLGAAHEAIPDHAFCAAADPADRGAGWARYQAANAGQDWIVVGHTS